MKLNTRENSDLQMHFVVAFIVT